MPGQNGNGKRKVRGMLCDGLNYCPECDRTLFEITEDGILKDCPRCRNVTVVFSFKDWPHNKRTSWSAEIKKP